MRTNRAARWRCLWARATTRLNGWLTVRTRCNSCKSTPVPCPDGFGYAFNQEFELELEQLGKITLFWRGFECGYEGIKRSARWICLWSRDAARLNAWLTMGTQWDSYNSTPVPCLDGFVPIFQPGNWTRIFGGQREITSVLMLNVILRK